MARHITRKLDRLERTQQTPRAVYDAAVSRHCHRLDVLIELRLGDDLRLLDSIIVEGGAPRKTTRPPAPPPESLVLDSLDNWQRDQAIIDTHHRRAGEPDGRRLYAYGTTPDEMFANFQQRMGEEYIKAHPEYAARNSETGEGAP